MTRAERILPVIPEIPVLHNYGHSGSGYQNSIGCANIAIDMLLKSAPAKKANWEAGVARQKAQQAVTRAAKRQKQRENRKKGRAERSKV